MRRLASSLRAGLKPARSPRPPRQAYEELTPTPTKTTRFATTALFAFAVFAQPPASAPMDRVLHFAHAGTDQELREIATNIWAITEISQVSIDTAQRTLTLHGTAALIALAEWLLNQWDNSTPAQAPDNPAAHQYRLSSDDVVQVFHLAHVPTPRTLQEVATDVRTIANIRRLFTYAESSVITARGGASQIALAEWLMNQLDQPASQAARGTASPEYRPSGTIDDVVLRFLTRPTLRRSRASRRSLPTSAR